MPEPNFVDNKLGDIDIVVQVDETMLNCSCKSHRGRSPDNRTDALVIVEVRSSVSRVFAKVIPNKKAETIIPLICNNVISGSTIYTDEHRAYYSLTSNGYVHGSVCHKYHFVDPKLCAYTKR